MSKDGLSKDVPYARNAPINVKPAGEEGGGGA